MRRGRRCAGSPAPPHRAAPRFRPGPRRRVVRPSPRRGRDGARRARGSAPDGPGAPPRPRSPWRGGPRGAQGRGREEPARACAYRTMGMVLKTLDRYLLKELGPPFVLGAGVLTFFLVIDRVYDLTDLVITKNVPFHLVMGLLAFMLPAFLGLTLPMALLVAVERDPKLSRVIVAKEGRLFTDTKKRRVTMRFIDGAVSETDAADARRFRLTAFSLYDLNLPLENPQSAAQRIEKPEKEMTLEQLRATVAELEPLGQIVTPFRVEIQKRFTLPVAALVFVTVGFPLGIRTLRGGRTLAMGSSLAIVVGYYVIHTFLEGLALRQRLPVTLAMWLPNALFGSAGLVLLYGASAGLPLSFARLLVRLRAALPRVLRTLVPRRSPVVRARREPAGVRGPRASTYLIDRYLVREYLIYIGTGLAVGAVLILVVDLLQYLDRFLRVKPPFLYILQHLFYRLPGSLYEGLPIIVLISTVFLFLSLTQARELDAMKAAGISLYRASLPVLLVALSISLVSVVLQETVLPVINSKADDVDRVKIRGNQPRHLQRQTQIWYRSSDTRFMRMELLDPIERSLDGLLVVGITPDFRLADRLDARKARWTREGWMLSDGVYRHVGPGNHVSADPFAERLATMPEQINDLIQVQQGPETMSFRELRTYVTRLAETGHNVGKYLVDLYRKLSFPLIHLIMALVAIPFALSSPRTGGRAVGIGVAILISVGYWVIHSIAIAFAKAELLPPLLGAWTANIVFAGVGAALFLRART